MLSAELQARAETHCIPSLDWESRFDLKAFVLQRARLLQALILLIRPPQLSKSFLGIVVAQFCALGNQLPMLFDVGLTSIGTMLIWGGLYGINDLTDSELDRLSPYKRYRPVALGSVSPKTALFFSCLAILAGVGMLLWMGGLVPLLLSGSMILVQLAYTLEPVRLKRRIFFDLVAAGVLSQSLRYLIGYFSVAHQHTGARRFVLVPLWAAVCWKIAAYLLYRLNDGAVTTDRNTTVFLGRSVTRWIAAFFYLVSMCSFFFYTWQNELSLVFQVCFLIVFLVVGWLFWLFQNRPSKLPRVLRYIVFSAVNERGHALRSEKAQKNIRTREVPIPTGYEPLTHG
jgi:4-hydroxybenzoate polyprenyltransferase